MIQNHVTAPKKHLRWKFLREVDGKIKSNEGDCTWTVGRTKTHKGKISLCNAGFHCSQEIYQAFTFVQGEILAQVEVSGEHVIESDKEVWQKMKILKAYRWQKKDSVALAIYAAELVLDIWEKEYPTNNRPRLAIEAAKKWLLDPTVKNADAAWAAARAAARAAGAAVRAAGAAAWAAAGAAGAAAGAAAGDAAWAARAGIISQVSQWMEERVSSLEEYK